MFWGSPTYFRMWLFRLAFALAVGLIILGLRWLFHG